jgi:hypothetical protein
VNFYQAVNTYLPDAATEGMQQLSGELRAHRPAELHSGIGVDTHLKFPRPAH